MESDGGAKGWAPRRAEDSPGMANTLSPVMTLSLSPAQTRISVLSQLLLDELHESAEGPLQDLLTDQLNLVLLDLDGAAAVAA